MKKQKIKNAIKRGAPIVAAVGVGVAIPILLGYKKPEWVRHDLSPETMKHLIDHPNSVVSFKCHKLFIGNTESTEVY